MFLTPIHTIHLKLNLELSLQVDTTSDIPQTLPLIEEDGWLSAGPCAFLCLSSGTYSPHYLLGEDGTPTTITIHSCTANGFIYEENC